MKLKYINLDFVKPNKDCNSCDHHDDYTCFECESLQVREKYPHAIYYPPEWYFKENEENLQDALDYKINKWGLNES
mgnify:FL=1|tara:strand:+ start:114 stop:341 length:228 start_codon:yes stop_codon:yes gene_type:complete